MKNARIHGKADPSALNSLEFTRRQQRAICALLETPVSREAIDRIAGCSNGPEVIRQLRKTGLAIPCSMVPGRDRDGRPTHHGVYSLTPADRATLENQGIDHA